MPQRSTDDPITAEAYRVFGAIYRADMEDPAIRALVQPQRAYFAHGYAEAMRASRARQAVEPWRPMICEVQAGYAICRWNPAGFREMWDASARKWSNAVASAHATREQATEQMRHIGGA